MEGTPPLPSSPPGPPITPLPNRTGRAPSTVSLLVLAVAFVLTRTAGAWLADHPEQYGRNITSDVGIYQYWADRIVEGEAPYTRVPVEYPPGSLPFIMAPAWLSGPASYRTILIVLMAGVDAAGLVGLVLIARRWGSSLGPWLWTAVIPLLGPIVYLRLDIVPAVATIWAVERMSCGAWAGAGAWLAGGAVAKLYPAMLLPLGMITTRQRRRYILGAVAVVGLALLPFASAPRGLVSNVLEHHAGRDIHIESSWGALLLLLSKGGLDVSVGFDAGSFNAVTAASSLVRIGAFTLAVLALGVATWFAARVVRRDDVTRLTALMYGTVSLIVGLSTVFSPQFVLWMLALGAAALCATGSSIRWPIMLLLPIAGLTQILYPFRYEHLLAVDASGLMLLGLRNALVLATGIWTFTLLWRTRAPTPRVGLAPEPSIRNADLPPSAPPPGG